MYVGDAASRREVYGYWTFVVGYVVGIAGVLVYLVGPGSANSTIFFQIREVAIVLSAVGLALGLLGIVFQLPVRSAGIWAATGGGVVAVLAVVLFVNVYPQNWLGAGSYNRTVIGVYVVGVGLIAGVAVLVPVLTGERSFLFEEGFEEEGQAIMVGEAERGGLFAVYRRGPADWRWRLLEQNAVADGVAGYASRPDVETVIDDVKSKVREAGLLEIKHAAFRLYEGDGRWQWLLMEEDGTAVATSPGDFDDRDAAEDTVSALKEYGPDAELLDIEHAAFDVERVGTDWRWRLVDDERASLAVSPETVDEREDADVDISRFKNEAADADVLSVQHLGFEVREEGDGWRWRIVDQTDTELAAAASVDDSRQAVRDRIDRVRRHAGAAPVENATEPAFELVERDGGWTWRLVVDDEVVGTNHGDAGARSSVEDDLDRFRATAADAPVVEGEDPAFELFRTDGSWNWRLVDESRDVLARGTAAEPGREDVTEAVDHVVDQTEVAELVEFEKAAFQLYEADSDGEDGGDTVDGDAVDADAVDAGGEWRWRLIDEGGSVLADSGEDYGSRDAAASSMTVLKENAPDADLLEIDSAAIELFQNDAGDWGWRLVDEGGTTVAKGDSRHETKRDAKDAVETMRAHVASADRRVVGDGAFQLFERRDADPGGWLWRFVAAEGDVVADGRRGHTTRDGVERAVAAVRDAVPGASSHEVTSLAFVLDSDADGWRFRLLDADREPLATGSETYADADAAGETVERIERYAADAEVFELRQPVYRVRERESGDWEWQLVDRRRRPIASAPSAYADRQAAEAAIEPVREYAAAAGVLEYENAAFEVFESDDGWHWRLVDEDGDELAVSTAAMADRDSVVDALDQVREAIADASILEIETSAFELHEGDTGWRWRLVDRHGDTVAESVTEYPTRSDAREGMNSLKDHGPEAGLVVAG